MRVLLIEDDVDLAATVAEYLAARGWQVDHAYDGLACAWWKPADPTW